MSKLESPEILSRGQTGAANHTRIIPSHVVDRLAMRRSPEKVILEQVRQRVHFLTTSFMLLLVYYD